MAVVDFGVVGGNVNLCPYGLVDAQKVREDDLRGESRCQTIVDSQRAARPPGGTRSGLVGGSEFGRGKKAPRFVAEKRRLTVVSGHC